MMFLICFYDVYNKYLIENMIYILAIHFKTFKNLMINSSHYLT